ncbi:hypothetical protein [Natronosalvus rutilus]|uniref:Uncharacterized protein n=1 Tax=Natronosalvus rutilus TaxID=2953753 RepID=A0A9E7SXA6_9EURY|nr:hypothetical protein [Natronosalvus rutilus]UTF54851.1 hypothetical protein NGM29_06200 [Natronosalvus rutilus]
MSSSNVAVEAASEPTPDRLRRFLHTSAGVVVLLTVVAVDPVLAQESVVCDAEGLPGMISGFFQITTALGLMGLVVVWQADSLVEMFTMNFEQKKDLKQHKRTALKSALILVILGPLYTVAGATMGLPLAECVDFVPW